ncbi:hypothetical protein TEA_010523 [Camellia sinensis var. sinensis]|uniref:Gfo/Idh/MocA-like oxidoreductase N-terminal domain-containing protein n=1 Tax=Camellia sinensis var. sinensis TaxID=542762 RepID=A0A4S4EIA1_CAMSN|nr:hypothetical protein TEA_010523 [Camellia sinensis var. sinensis]
MTKPPQIAILGAGIFVRTQYIPRLTEISDLVVLKAIWSRTEESARGAVEIARKFFPEVECKWGDTGLDEIIQNTSIVAVAVDAAARPPDRQADYDGKSQNPRRLLLVLWWRDRGCSGATGGGNWCDDPVAIIQTVPHPPNCLITTTTTPFSPPRSPYLFDALASATTTKQHPTHFHHFHPPKPHILVLIKPKIKGVQIMDIEKAAMALKEIANASCIASVAWSGNVVGKEIANASCIASVAWSGNVVGVQKRVSEGRRNRKENETGKSPEIRTCGAQGRMCGTLAACAINAVCNFGSGFGVPHLRENLGKVLLLVLCGS